MSAEHGYKVVWRTRVEPYPDLEQVALRLAEVYGQPGRFRVVARETLTRDRELYPEEQQDILRRAQEVL